MKIARRLAVPRNRRAHVASRLHSDALAIATGAPQVIAARLTRMALHGVNPSPRDRQEMKRMSAEKVDAFGESWVAMGAQAMRMQQAWWSTWWSGVTSASLGRPSSMATWSSRNAKTMTDGMTGIAAAGLAPVRQQVASNVQRLGLHGTKQSRSKRPR